MIASRGAANTGLHAKAYESVALTLKERPKSTWRHHTNVLAHLVANTLTNSNSRPTNRPFTFSSCFIATSKILSIFATKYPVTKVEMRLAD